jgi:hypothetical protein
LPHTSIEIIGRHSLKEITSSSFGRPVDLRIVGDVSREDFISLTSPGPIFGRFSDEGTLPFETE